MLLNNDYWSLQTLCWPLSLVSADRILVGSQGHAAEPSVGLVTRAENDAQVISAGSSTAARVGYRAASK
jgi:hypothetical protein